MGTEATVSGETMEDVLRELGFVPATLLEGGVTQRWINEAAGVIVRQYDGCTWGASSHERFAWLRCPIQLRAIVRAEQRCEAAWRGEAEPGETDR